MLRFLVAIQILWKNFHPFENQFEDVNHEVIDDRQIFCLNSSNHGND